jgi:hypothetical protein
MPGQPDFYGLHGFLIYMPSLWNEPTVHQILEENWEPYPLADDMPFPVESLD